ncbi:MAG: phospholipid carrier-dependent glycosyltransferase, partial [Clostridia bacterium]|nr:phospholipid carrier-dependent glycosyltransferase [Clostridia bacterium]
ISLNEIVMFIFIAGVILRLSFVTSASVFDYQHDVFDQRGHFDYILNIVNNFELPSSNKMQYYHPPLHYFISALVLRPFVMFGVTDEKILGNILQYLTAFYSVFIMMVALKILDRLKLNVLPKLAAFAIIAFHPTFFILAGSINNDCLCILFMFLSVYFAIRWYENPYRKRTTALLALCFGLAVMSKISAALLCVPIGFVFLYKFFTVEKDTYRKERIKRILTMFGLFLLIALPLSLWYPVRNYILFDQSLLYIPRLSEDSWLYCGDISLFNRLNPLNLNLSTPFCDVGNDYNLADYTLKCSLFGEWDITSFTTVAYILLCVNLLLTVISLACMIYILISRKYKMLRPINIFFAVLWLTQIISFVITNINYPFGCTMDFRYIVLTILCGAVFIAQTLQRVNNKWLSLVRT